LVAAAAVPHVAATIAPAVMTVAAITRMDMGPASQSRG
jgi:hypothetical protein